MVLTYLDTINPVYSSTSAQIMGSSVVSFLSETSLSEECHLATLLHQLQIDLPSNSGEAVRGMRGPHWWLQRHGGIKRLHV